MAQPHPTDDVRYYYGTQRDATRRDVEVFRAARLVLIGELFGDPQVRRLFTTAEGLARAAYKLAEHSDRLAAAFHFRGRHDLLARLAVGLDLSYVPEAVVVTFAEWQVEYRTFHSVYRASVPACVRSDRELVTETWQLPWPWLTSDVCRMFRAFIDGIVLDVPFDLRQFAVTVTAHGGGSQRRGAHINAERIARDVSWFYRNAIHDPSVKKNALARESKRSWQLVDTSIKRVRRVFADVPNGAVVGELPLDETHRLVWSMPARKR